MISFHGEILIIVPNQQSAAGLEEDQRGREKNKRTGSLHSITQLRIISAVILYDVLRIY